MMYLFKAFISGIVIPTIVLPIFLFIAICAGRAELLEVYFVHLIPVIWGIWNVLYFAVCKECLPVGEQIKHFLTGGTLGLLVAIYGIFWAQVPQVLGLQSYEYWPLLIAPVVYALLWHYLLSSINGILGLTEKS